MRPLSWCVVVGLALACWNLVGQEGVPTALDYWPSWRGPLHTGVSPTASPPTEWSETKNVRWKIPMPGRGHASPVVWGDRLFVATAVPADPATDEAHQDAARQKLEEREFPPNVAPNAQNFVVMAIARDDGEVLWKRVARSTVPTESHHIDASWASASPVTDGERVYVSFGSHGIYAFDFDGEPLWERQLGTMSTRRGFGEGSSPALAGGRLVINWDHEGDSFIVALDAATGEELWRRVRDEPTSWATPLVVEQGGRAQVVVPATGASRGYDLETGEELWSLPGMTVNVIPTPVYRDGLVYLMSGYRGNMVQAVPLSDAKGELDAATAVAWSFDRHTPYVPSPVLVEDRLIFLKRFGNVLTALDADDGAVLFTEHRLEPLTNVYASPVGADGKLYFVDRDGNTVVTRMDAPTEVLAHNELDDGFEASPAIAGDALFLRGRENLYCLAEDPR